MRDHSNSKVGIALILAMLATAFALPVSGVSAQQQNEIVLTVDFDGTAAFTGTDPLDDGLGAHTPGSDLNDANNVVRTNDQIQYRVDWNVNEVDGTATTLRMTLPDGVTWMEDGSTVTGVPSGCTDDGTSSITGNGGRDLVCLTDDEHEGSNGAIHPRALVGALLDGTPLAVKATVETAELPAVESNEITTFVSARPAGDWVKGEPIKDADSGAIIAYEPDEMYWDVLGPNPSGAGPEVVGRLFVWSLRLEPAGGLKGSEPMDDSMAIELWDHFFDAVPGTQLATSAQMLAATGLNRVPCGGYDGDAGYPYGVTAGVASTTPASQTNVGTWTCAVPTVSSTGYPIVEIDIMGQDTTNIAPQNANLTPNASTLVSGQIAFWAPENELQNKPVPQIIVNAITGSVADVAPGTSDVDPILIHGTNGSLPEISEPANGLAGVSNNSPYEFPTSPPGEPGRAMRHWIHYQNGPYQEVEFEPLTGGTYRTYDTRDTTKGGTGRAVTNGADGPNENSTRWDGDGQTPRGNVLTVISGVQTNTTKNNGNLFSTPVHLCVAVDTTHQEVVGMPASFPVFDPGAPTTANANAQTYSINRDTIGGRSEAPASPIAQVLSSIAGSKTSVWHPTSVPAVRTDWRELDYVLEVASIASETNVVGVHEVTCNGDEATWVDAKTGDLTQFETGTMTDGTPIYGDVTHFRVRTSGDVPWQSPDLNTAGNSFASRVNLNFQVRVKEDPILQAADQELFVYAARARGDWDGTGQPPTDSCTNGPTFGADNEVIPLGWCNLDFTDDAAITGGDSTDLTDFKNDFDASVIEFVDVNGTPRLSHADAVYIVEPALAISKVNTDGPADITANGGIVEFEINPKVVGSSLDTIADVTVSDTLPATMEFVQFTSLPTDGTCTQTGQTISCTYGSHPGGWGNSGEGKFSFEVRIRDAGANATLTNTATITGNDSNTGDPKAPASSKAQAFTGAPYEESGIEKSVDAHLGECFEAPGASLDSGDCTFIAVDGGMIFNLDVENEGNVDLPNYRVIDVLPHLLDATEPPSAAHPFTGVALTGDGRTPPSSFTGDLNFVAASGPGATVYYTMDDADSISRDPAVADSGTTWCNSPASGIAVAVGLAPAAGTDPCPAAASDVTAVYYDLGTLLKGETRILQVELTTVGADCGDIWTNNFGARTSGLLLPIRSNDVSVMAGFCDPSIDIEKDTNGLQSDVAPGAQIVAGDPVTWTYVVTNDGDVALADAIVSDVPAPAGGISCDIDGDGTFDGVATIPLMLPNDSVTCEATGVAQAGPFANNASVSGTPVLPDFSDPSIDPSDPTTWPTDAASFSAPVDPVTGGPALDDQVDEDPSHYTGIDPVPAIGIEKDTNGLQSDVAPGAPLVPGQAVTWSYEVTNTGTGALADATVTDVGSDGVPITVDCDVDGDGALDGTNVIPLVVPGASVTCESTGVAGAVDYSNNASVTGDLTVPTAGCVCDPTDPTTWPTDPADYDVYVDPLTGETSTVDDEDPSHYTAAAPAIDIEKDTNGAQSDVAPGETLFAGQDVTWTYVVTNTGDTALIDATVADSDPAVVVDCDVDGDGSLDGTNVIPFLAVAGSVTCEATGVAVTGDYMNSATVSGSPALPDFSDPAVDPADPSTWPTDPADYGVPTDPDGNPVAPVDDADDSHYTGLPNGPAIDIEKDTNGAQSDVAPGETLFAGQDVTWTYVVTNTGNTAVLDATVSDSDPAAVVDCDVDGDGALDGTNVIPFLAIGDSVTCESTGVAQTGQYMNTAAVSGDPATPDPSTCGCDPLDPATWPTDPAGYGPAIGPDGLAFGAVDDADDSHYLGAANGPAIDIEKDTNGAQSDTAPGEEIADGAAVTWTYVVTNTGNTALTNAVVSDSDSSVTVDCDVDGDGALDGTNVIAFLPVGGAATCEATGVAQVGPYMNTASVSGDPITPDASSCGCDPEDPTTWPTDPALYGPAIGPDGQPFAAVSDADDSHYTGFSTVFDLALEKALASGQATSVEIGDSVTFVITVTNEGDLEAMNVEITDTLPTSMTLDDSDWTDNGDGTASYVIAGPVAPGDSVDVEITVEVTASGSLENNAEITNADPARDGVVLAGVVINDVDSSPDDGAANQDDIDQAGVTVAAAVQESAPALAFTGTSATSSLLLAALTLLSLGTIGLLASGRRREDETEA